MRGRSTRAADRVTRIAALTTRTGGASRVGRQNGVLDAQRDETRGRRRGAACASNDS
jgi:hypothetical protein